EHAALQVEAAGPIGRRRRWRRRLLRIVGAIVVLVMAYLALTFIQVWRASSEDGAQPADAIVVLGAAQYDGRPSPVLEARLQRALELYEMDLAPVIVVTGGRQDGDTFTEATAGYNWLRAEGVPDEAIEKEVQGRSTYESLAATARFLRDDDVMEVVLVTDGYHALRVSGIAREVGLTPHVSGVDMDGPTIAQLSRETGAVALGRIIGYRRLTNLVD
ncbi:MAG TPA: YdcF family protein, partial [Candidatus Limnocylindria bacterium]